MDPRASYKYCSDSMRGPSPFRVDIGNFVVMHIRRNTTRPEN